MELLLSHASTERINFVFCETPFCDFLFESPGYEKPLNGSRRASHVIPLPNCLCMRVRAGLCTCAISMDSDAQQFGSRHECLECHLHERRLYVILAIRALHGCRAGGARFAVGWAQTANRAHTFSAASLLEHLLLIGRSANVNDVRQSHFSRILPENISEISNHMNTTTQQ